MTGVVNARGHGAKRPAGRKRQPQVAGDHQPVAGEEVAREHW